ncbi:hypothetical protein BDZ91DRAFT_711258 [Kalaharituber pfeilii]|nr:hypothetical protein BDZ91DRAFT_711258 [Kalaharituber pfeilii]
MLADLFGPSFGLNWQYQWLGVLKFISEPVHAIIRGNPPAPLSKIPAEEVDHSWLEIGPVHDCTLFGILTDFANWRLHGEKDADAQVWMQYYPQHRAQDYVRDAGWRGKQWRRIANGVGAGLLYAIACSPGIDRWARKTSEGLSKHELNLVIAWIKANPELLAYCSDLTRLMAKMLRGQKPEHSAVEVAELIQRPLMGSLRV